MPFQVYLSPTTASPPAAQIEADVRAAISAEGGRIDRDGVAFVTADGLTVTFAGDGRRFLVDKLSPSFCRIVFNAAQRSNSTVNRGGTDLTPLQMKGSRDETRYDHVRTDPIADPVALCARLERNLQEWNRTVSADQANGILGPDEQLLGPPPTPGTEPRLTADTTGVAAYCEAAQQPMAKLGWRIVRQVASQNAQYGVVWRADVTAPGNGGDLFRVICWKRPGRADYSMVFRPLTMFDASGSIPPLGE
jgi:hypothetical protein